LRDYIMSLGTTPAGSVKAEKPAPRRITKG
jgi:hypothetical protein